jgi:phosphoserine phosphatase
LLFTEWLPQVNPPQDTRADGTALRRLPAYIAKRARELPLAEDPCFGALGYRWTGWDEIVEILRGAYGKYVGRMKAPAIRRALSSYVAPAPTATDGRMGPDDWIQTESGMIKTDFEHHNFGGAERDIVDPAYDVVSAIFEFRMSEHEEQDLIRSYVHETGDRTVSDRILLYTLLYGARTMKDMLYRITHEASDGRRGEWNERYIRARTFLADHLHRSCASRMAQHRQIDRSQPLLFLDLDGVFDCELFGFPHTTSSGLAAIALLDTHRIPVVLNTGRSVEHVTKYCRSYGFPGGLGEYGSVFVDAVCQHEVPLITAQGVEQLARCREAISAAPDLFIDPEYRYAIRTYRYNGKRTAGLQPFEIKDILARSGCDKLIVINRCEDTYIIEDGIDKGRGLLAVKERLAYAGPVIAIGDSDQDLPMLKAADYSYAPANCSESVRKLAKERKHQVLSQPYQRGLLAAVRDVVHNGASRHDAECVMSVPPPDGGLIHALLRAADRPATLRFLSVLNWKSL